jgi:hypothetical protein
MAKTVLDIVYDEEIVKWSDHKQSGGSCHAGGHFENARGDRVFYKNEAVMAKYHGVLVAGIIVESIYVGFSREYRVRLISRGGITITAKEKDISGKSTT